MRGYVFDGMGEHMQLQELQRASTKWHQNFFAERAK